MLSRIQSHGKCSTGAAVLESTGNIWMRIHYTLEENEMDIILANPYKTKDLLHNYLQTVYDH